MLTVLRDHWEHEYEFNSEIARRTLLQYGHPCYWVTVPQYLTSPLPEWAVREILQRYSLVPRRFPRFAFGHEFFQLFRHNVDPNYIDIRIRAAIEWTIRSTELGDWRDEELDEVALDLLSRNPEFSVNLPSHAHTSQE